MSNSLGRVDSVATVNLTIREDSAAGLEVSPRVVSVEEESTTTAQTVTATAAVDNDGDGKTVTLTHTQTGVTEYVSVTASAMVHTTDNDARGLVVDVDLGMPGSPALTVTEAMRAEYTLALNTDPGGPVTVTVTSSKATTRRTPTR